LAEVWGFSFSADSSEVEALLKFPEEMRGDFAGGVGFSVDSCLLGVLVTGRSSDFPLVLEGSELGKTCSFFTIPTTSAVGTFS
jgi:hypothetical protein